MPRKKQDRPKRSESEIPLDLTVKKSDDDIDPIKLSEPRSSSISPGIVSLSIFVSPNPKGNKTTTPTNVPTTTISRVSGSSVNNYKSSGNSKSTSKTLNNVIHSSSSVKHSNNNGNDSRSTKEGSISGTSGSGTSGGGANRQNPWQTQWINRSSEQNRDVFTCVWCKDSFRCLAEMTQHMKASPRCGMAGMQQATSTATPGLTNTPSNSLLSSSSSSLTSLTTTTTTSTTGTYPLIVPSIAGLAASSTASRSTTPTSIGTGTSTNKGKNNVDLRESLSTPSTPSSMKSSSSISPSLHHPNQTHHHSSSSPNQGPTNSNSDSNNSNLPNQNSTKEPMSSSVLAKNSVNLPRKLVRGQDVWLGRGAEQTRQILKCMWCGQSFKTLEDMTRHMRVTQHYTNIISQEQIISWKTPEDKLAQAHVNAVLTCKVCDESFGSLKELSNHIIKNAHYKEHIIRSMTEGGHGRRRQTRERRKKSLPVRKLLELERMELVGKEGVPSVPTGGPSSPGSSVRCSSSERASSASPSLPVQSGHSLVPSLPPPPPPPPAHQHSHPASSSTSTSHHSISSPSSINKSSSRSAKNDFNNHHHSHSHQMIINPTDVVGSRLSSSLSSSSMITCDECNEKLDAKNFIAHIKICKSLPSSSSSSDRKSPSLSKLSTSPLPTNPANNLSSSSLKVPTSSFSNANNPNNSNNRDKDNLPSEGSGIKSETSAGGVQLSSSSILGSFGLNHQGSADDPLVSSGDSPPTTPATSGSFLSSIEKLIEKSFDSKSRKNQTTGILQRLGIDEEVCPPWQSLSGSTSSQNNITGHSESHHSISGPSFASWSQQLEKYSFHGLKDRLSTSPVPSGASSSYQDTRGENGSIPSSSESSCDDSNSSFDHHSHNQSQSETLNANNKHHRNKKIDSHLSGSTLRASGSPSAAALAAAAAAVAATSSTVATGATPSSTPTGASGNDVPMLPSGSGIGNKSSSSLSFPMSSMISRLEETIARITGSPSSGFNNNTSSNNNNSNNRNNKHSQPSNSPSPSSVHSSNSNPGTPIINHNNRSSSASHRTHNSQAHRSHHSSNSHRSSYRSHHSRHHRPSSLSSPPPQPHFQSSSLLSKLPNMKSTIKRESLSELSEDEHNVGPNSPKRRFRQRSEEESAGSPDRSNPVSPESLRSPGLSTPDSIDSDRSQAEDLSKIK